MRLTIVLLLSLAVTSIIGTLIPRNESPENYLKAFGERLYRVFDILDIFDMYHSVWFQALLLLLTINIVVCSIDRLSTTWKIIFVKNPKFNVSRFRNRKDKLEFSVDQSIEQLKQLYKPLVSKGFGYNRIEETDNEFRIFVEKGRWTRLGVYVVHMSVIFLLIGAIIGSIFGFDGFVNIPEGETVSAIRLRNSPDKLALEFEIRCEDFNVSFYDSGAPKEFRSSLTILNQGKPVLKKDIVVNDPLRYKGINIFQSSYGMLPPNEVTLSLTSKATGKVYKKKAKIGQEIAIPEDKGTFILKTYRNAAEFRGQNIGEAFIGTLTPKNGKPAFVLIPLRFPSFDKMRKGEVIISVTESKNRFYTGLQVTKDPGVWIVYSGFILMIVGCYITFFMSHQQLCVEVAAKGNTTRVMVAGTASKNKLAIQQKVKKISERLANLELRA